jgi:hypothetical protein
MSIVRGNGVDRHLGARESCIPSSQTGSAWAIVPPNMSTVARICARLASLVRRHAPFILVLAISALYLFAFMRVMTPRTDEGIFLSGAVRLVQGQVFARDFMEVTGPGTFYWLALFFKIFGISFLAAHLCLFLSWLATMMLIYRLSRHITAPYRLVPLLLIVVTCLASLGVGISHHVDSNCLVLLTVLCLSVWHDRRKARWLAFAGGLAALTALVHQHKGLFLLIAALAWVWMIERKRKTSVRAFAVVIAGFAGILGIAAIYFAAHGAFSDLVRANIVWPFQHYSAINNVPYGWGTFSYFAGNAHLRHFGEFLFASVLIVPFLYVAILPGMLTLQVWRCRLQSMHADFWLFLLCGISLWVSELHRKDITHLALGSPLLIILSVQLFSQSRKLFSRLVLVLLTASASTLSICSLIAILKAHPVTTRVGQVNLLGGGEEIAALNARIPPGESMLVYPYCPSYYFLTETENPTPFSTLLSSYNTPEQMQDVIRILDTGKVKHVLWDLKYKSKSLPFVFPAALHLPDDLAPLDVYLRAHYKIIWSQNDFQILERKREPMVH